MNYQTDKFTPPARLITPQDAPSSAPMYSSPWLALYLHLKANLNQNSAS